MSILGANINDLVFSVPSFFMFGFVVFETYNCVYDLIYTIKPITTHIIDNNINSNFTDNNIIEKSIKRFNKDQILDFFRFGFFKEVLLYSSISFNNKYDQLLNNKDFISCISDWIFLKNDDELNLLLCNKKYDLSRNFIKKNLIIFCKTSSIGDVDKSLINPELLELIVLDIDNNL